MSEPLPCPECGVEAMRLVVEDCRLADGVEVPRLRHYRCKSCGSRFFPDEAMETIRSVRTTASGTLRVAEGPAAYGKRSR